MAFFKGLKTQKSIHMSSRRNRRAGTKTKVIKNSDNQPPKSRNSRMWKKNGRYQLTIRNPKFKSNQ